MLDILTNAPREIHFGERTFQVGALKIKELGLLQRWIREHAVSPSERLEEQLKILPEEDHRKLRYEAAIAEKNWPPQINTYAGNEILLNDLEGQLYFLKIMLGKFQPDLTDEAVNEVAEGLSELDMAVLVRIAFGEDDLDPKALKADLAIKLAAFQKWVNQNLNPTLTGSDSSTQEGDTDPTGAESSGGSTQTLPT